jgi:hypothetical protein
MTKKDLKLKVTPTSNPVSLAAPVVKEKADVSTKVEPVVLPEITNKTTGNILFVLGTCCGGKLKVSTRLWMTATAAGFTQLGIRIRVGDAADKGTNVPGLVKAGGLKFYNAITSTGSGGEHVSMEGFIRLPENPWEEKAVIIAFVKSGFAAQLHAQLSESLPDLDIIDAKKLNMFYAQQIAKVLGDVAMPKSVVEAKVTTIMLGKQDHPFIQSKTKGEVVNEFVGAKGNTTKIPGPGLYPSGGPPTPQKDPQSLAGL